MGLEETHCRQTCVNPLAPSRKGPLPGLSRLLGGFPSPEIIADFGVKKEAGDEEFPFYFLWLRGCLGLPRLAPVLGRNYL